MTILYFILALSLLVFVHELGHFIMAKRAGIRVDEFAIGFGPRLFGIKRGETDYRFCLIPLGGYVKLLGQDPDDEGGNDPRAFSQKGLLPRMKILVAGPFMNVFLSLLLMPLVFFLGREMPTFMTEPPLLLGVQTGSSADGSGLHKGDLIQRINGKEVKTWEEVLTISSPLTNISLNLKRGEEVYEVELRREPQEIFFGFEAFFFLGGPVLVDQVLEGSAAQMSKLQKGDIIHELNGLPLHGPADFTTQISRSQGKTLHLTLERDGVRRESDVEALFDQESKRWLLGIQVSQIDQLPMTLQRSSLVGSLQKGFDENLRLLGLIGDMLKKLVTLDISYKQLGGPIAIAKTSAQAAQSGFSEFIYFLAFLSLQLGILNLLPIPVLDGGHLLFLGIEGVRGKPLPKKMRFIIQQAGFAFLLALMIAVTINDIKRLFG